VTSPSGQQVEIVFGDQRAVVVEVGGGLRSYQVGGQELLDGYGAEDMCSSGRGQVLIPWPNRLQDGSYEFDGRRLQLPLTESAAGNAIHGLVRWASWRVEGREADRVVLAHPLHPQPGYPFSLTLRIEYTLSETGLAVRTTATNVGPSACPYGAGAHPYLTLGRPTVDPLVLRVPAGSVVTSDPRGLPTGTTAVEGTEYDFRRPRTIGATVLDNAFTDLRRDEDGLARVELRDPADGAGITLWVDETYEYLMVFTGDPLPDVNRRSLAVEPMTCPPNAFRTGDSLIRLEPGASVTTVWGIARFTLDNEGDKSEVVRASVLPTEDGTR
jgi:aldose 1-epimerase